MENLTINISSRWTGYVMKYLMMCIFCLSIHYYGDAQSRWGLKFHPNLSFPVSSVNGAHPNTAFGYDITVGYKVFNNFIVHAGWGLNIFPAEKSADHKKDGYEETRFILGGQFFQSLSGSRLFFMIGAGGLLTHFEAENINGNIHKSMGNGSGWFAETALSYTLTERWSISPGIRYTYLSEKIGDPENERLLFKYISPGVEISYLLGKD